MANPITWKNINAPDFTGVARIQEAAGARFDKAFEAAGAGLDQFNTHTANVQQNNDAIFRDKLLQAAQTPEELQSMIASGGVDALKSRFAGGLTQGKFANELLDNQLLPDQQALFKTQVDQLTAAKDLQGLNALRGTELFQKDAVNNTQNFNSTRNSIISGNVVNKGVEDFRSRGEAAIKEKQYQNKFETQYGTTLAAINNGTEKDPVKLEAAAEYLDQRNQRIGQTPSHREYMDQITQQYIDAGVEPGIAKQQADADYTAILNEQAIPASMKQAKAAEYKVETDLVPNNDLAQEVFNPQSYGGFTELLTAEQIDKMPNHMRDSLITVDGWAQQGFVPVGGIGNDTPIPMNKRVANSLYMLMNSTESGLGDFFMPGTRNAQEMMEIFMDRGGITPKQLKEVARAQKRKAEIDGKYLRENTPTANLGADLGSNNLRAAAQQIFAQQDENGRIQKDAAITQGKIQEDTKNVAEFSDNELKALSELRNEQVLDPTTGGTAGGEKTDEAVAANDILDARYRLSRLERKEPDNDKKRKAIQADLKAAEEALSTVRVARAKRAEEEAAGIPESITDLTGKERKIAEEEEALRREAERTGQTVESVTTPPVTPPTNQPAGLTALQQAVEQQSTPDNTLPITQAAGQPPVTQPPVQQTAANTTVPAGVQSLQQAVQPTVPAQTPTAPTTLTGPETVAATTQAAPLPAQAERLSAAAAEAAGTAAPTEIAPTSTPIEQEAALSRSGVDISTLGSRQSTFLKPIIGAIQKSAQRLGASPVPIMAMAALESGWNGNSKTLFGVKRYKDGQDTVTSDTSEFRNGKMVKEKAEFVKYRNNDEAIAGFADFLQENPRYKSALASASDPEQFIKELHLAGYATDPDYSYKVINIMRGMQGKPKLTAQDKIAMRIERNTAGEIIT